MKRLTPNQVLIIITFIISVIYWAGVSSVPFHPDESTQLFTSSDTEIFLKNPADLFWHPQPSDALRQHYRLVDAPLTRTLIGLGRMIWALPSISTDWDWSKSWSENSSAGALPDRSLLAVARFSVAWLFPLSLILIYKIGERVNGARMGWIAFVLLATNSLVLIHTRRAMAESALLFTILLSIWALISCNKRPWLVAIPIALAFSAKQSAAPLLLIGFIALFIPGLKADRLSKKFFEVIKFVLIATLTIFMFHPFLWSNPVQAAQQAWISRQELVNRQVATLEEIAPDQVLDTVPKRFLGILANLYLTPPAIEDVANYTVNTQEAAAGYLSNFLHSLLRDSNGAALFFALSLVGFLLATRDALKQPANQRRDLSLLLFASVLQFIGQIIFIALPFQRYVIPLVPYSCLWAAYCAARFLVKIQNARQSSQKQTSLSKTKEKQAPGSSPARK